MPAAGLTAKERRQLPLLDHYHLLCRENHVRKPNSTIESFFRSHTQKDAAFQEYHLRKREILADRQERINLEEERKQNGGPSKSGGFAASLDEDDELLAPVAELIPPKPELTAAEEVEQLLGPMPPGPETYEITELVLDGNYMGNHSLVVLVHLLKWSVHLSKVTRFSMKKAHIYVGDERPTAVKGNHLIKLLCTLLFNHPSLKVIDLSSNEIATEAYLWLVELCKSATVLEELILDETLLQDHEQFHLQSVLQRNIKFHRKNAASVAAAASLGNSLGLGSPKMSPTEKPGGPAGDAASVRFWLKGDQASMAGSLAGVPGQVREKTYLEKYTKVHAPGQISGTGGQAGSLLTGVDPNAITTSPNAPNLAASVSGQSAAVWTAIEAAKTRRVEGVKTLTSQMSGLLGLQHVRCYSKSPEEREYLVQMLKMSPLFKLLLPPSDLGPQLTDTAKQEAKVRILNFEEKEVVRQQELEDSRKKDRVEDILHFLASVLLKATYQDKDVVVDEGDSSEWVFFIGPSSHKDKSGEGATIEAMDGSVAFAEGNFFGEEEMLSTLDPGADSIPVGADRGAASILGGMTSAGTLNAPLSAEPLGVPAQPFVGASAQQTGAAPRRLSYHAKVPGSATSLSHQPFQPTGSQSMYHHPPTNNDSLTPKVPTVILYQLRREVFLTFFGRDLVTQRAMWRRFTEAVPAFIGISPYGRTRLCDSLHKQKYVNGEAINYSAREYITFVMDGVVTIKNVDNRRVEAKTLARGEYFAFHENMDDAPAQIVAHHAGDFQSGGTTTGQPQLWVIPADMISRWYPLEVGKQLSKFRKFWW